MLKKKVNYNPNVKDHDASLFLPTRSNVLWVKRKIDTKKLLVKRKKVGKKVINEHIEEALPIEPKKQETQHEKDMKDINNLKVKLSSNDLTEHDQEFQIFEQMIDNSKLFDRKREIIVSPEKLNYIDEDKL